MSILTQNDVRIFRPWELEIFINSIPKIENKTKFEVLFYTGARYAEIKRLYNNSRWFNGVSIEMPNKKKKSRKKSKSRNIRLNPQGMRAVNEYLYRCKRELPHYVSWSDNIKRWGEMAGLDEPETISIKTTRKTWESYLVTKYQDKLLFIFQSQGHTKTTAVEHYLNLGFTDEDIVRMETYTQGWI